MTERERLLTAYGRYLELEGQLPAWQLQLQEKKEELEDAKQELHYQKVQLLSAQNPDFFQRLFGKWEAKVEKAQEAVRTATGECEKLKWDIAQLETMLEQGQKEFDRLALDVKQYQRMLPLEREEVHYLAPAAIAAAQRCLEALQAAAPWMRADARTTRVVSGNRRMEFLARAQTQAETLMGLYALTPKGTLDVGNYLRNPDYYIRGVTSEYAQLDRLNNAITEVRDLRNRWKEMVQ